MCTVGPPGCDYHAIRLDDACHGSAQIVVVPRGRRGRRDWRQVRPHACPFSRPIAENIEHEQTAITPITGKIDAAPHGRIGTVFIGGRGVEADERAGSADPIPLVFPSIAVFPAGRKRALDGGGH